MNPRVSFVLGAYCMYKLMHWQGFRGPVGPVGPSGAAGNPCKCNKN